ncbi:DNA-binding protein HU-beta [Bradyrhizobium sp. JR3.5]
MAKKAATPATITLKHLAAAIAEEQELSKKQAEAILTDMVTRITKHLKKGERIRIVGLGILQVRKRAAPHGPQPGDRRADPHQGEQEGRLPRRQGAEGSRLRLLAFPV